MSINFSIRIQKKDLWLLAAIMVFLVGVGYVIAYRSGASPSVMGHSAEELEGVQARIAQGLTACAGANQAIKTINPDTGVVTCETDDVGSGSGGGRNSTTFEVYNSDTTTYACVEKNLTDFCGDEDGCDIRIEMQHETDGNDQVRIIDEHIFMEQSSMSNNRNSGKYGWTRQGGGGDYSWITGAGLQYTIFDPWGWVWMFNYRHDYCPGQVGNGPAYSDHYKFTFMSHPQVRTKLIVYD